MMDCEIKEYFSILLEACHVEEISLDVAYRQLRELLERLCRTQMSDGSLQMTDLSARISFVASKAGLSTVEQNRLHTFRLTSNAILNRQAEPQREQLLRDAKTLAFFVKRLTGEEIPAELYRLLPRADATYIVAPPAKERIKQTADTDINLIGSQTETTYDCIFCIITNFEKSENVDIHGKIDCQECRQEYEYCE